MVLTQSLIVIFSMISVGFFCAQKKIFSPSQTEGFEIFLFKIAMPCYLFSSILSQDLEHFINTPYIYSYITSFLAVSLLVILISYIRKDDVIQTCIKTLASGYVNAAIYTLPVITFLLHNPIAGILGNMIQVVLIQSLVITILSFLSHKEKSIKKRLWIVFSNPLITMPLSGLVLNGLKLDLNPVVMKVLERLGSGSSSLALFVFGLTLGHMTISKSDFNRHLCGIVLIKNVIHPLFACLIGKFIFHLEAYWFCSLVIATSAPTAFVVYLIAKQFSAESEFVKKVVVLSSIVSLLSLVVIASLLSEKL